MADDIAVCRSTAFGAGCGHPVTEHDGDQTRPCCCCNRNHNDPEHAEHCLDCAVKHVKRSLGVTAGQAHVIAPLLPEHLRGPFWRAAVERYIAHEIARVEGGDHG